MRRRTRASSAGVPPAELLIGTCVEVWAGEDCEPWPPRFSAQRRHRAARRAWAAANGLDEAGSCRAMPAGGPWSVESWIAQGRRAEVDERLARAGCVLADVPGLRAAATAYLAGSQ